MMKMIWFDMDGTIADFYGVEGWLNYLRNEDTTPYSVAKPLLNMSLLARYIHKLQARGYGVGIITWGCKYSTDDFLKKVGCAKLHWLERHLPSVNFDKIYVEHYGTHKFNRCGGGILFDDEDKNRESWQDEAYEPAEIFNVLKGLVA